MENDHQQAVESLTLQQRKLKEVQEDRSKLLEESSRQETQLRTTLAELEQEKLKFEKLRSSRQTLGDQATEQAEQITALKGENEKLRQQIEDTLRECDAKIAAAQAAAQQAQLQTADAVFQQLWQRMQQEIAELFTERHVPTVQTFEQLCEAFVELVRACVVTELHVHHMLRDLRQVSEQSDKLNHFYIMLTKNPGLIETLRDYLVTGKRKGNFVNLLRAEQAWARAFTSGLYKLIVRSPVLIGEELSHKSWPIKAGFTQSEDAVLGKYYREVAAKTIPEKLGTAFRKHAADMAYEDYNDLMKRAQKQ